MYERVRTIRSLSAQDSTAQYVLPCRRKKNVSLSKRYQIISFGQYVLLYKTRNRVVVTVRGIILYASSYNGLGVWGSAPSESVLQIISFPWFGIVVIILFSKRSRRFLSFSSDDVAKRKKEINTHRSGGGTRMTRNVIFAAINRRGTELDFVL